MDVRTRPYFLVWRCVVASRLHVCSICSSASLECLNGFGIETSVACSRRVDFECVNLEDRCS